MIKTLTIQINIIHSKEGGEESDSYPVNYTIERIRFIFDDIIKRRIPKDHLCSLVVAESK